MGGQAASGQLQLMLASMGPHNGTVQIIEPQLIAWAKLKPSKLD